MFMILAKRDYVTFD